MSWVCNYAVAVMPTTILLFHVPIWPTRGHHLLLVRNQVKKTEEPHAWVSTYFKIVKLVCIDYNPCPAFTNWRLLQCLPLFSLCLFLFDPEAIICHWWGIKSKWPKKPLYEYQCILNWCCWSILIHNTCPAFTIWWLLQCPPLFYCCFFLFYPARGCPSGK
jgi:hypothetical protein